MHVESKLYNVKVREVVFDFLDTEESHQKSKMEEEDLSSKESNSHTFKYLNKCTSDVASKLKESNNHVGIYMEEAARTEDKRDITENMQFLNRCLTHVTIRDKFEEPFLQSRLPNFVKEVSCVKQEVWKGKEK